MIALITDTTPPKNYLERRTTKLQNENTGHATFDMESAIKEYNEFAIFELRQFMEDISAN